MASFVVGFYNEYNRAFKANRLAKPLRKRLKIYHWAQK
jgi:hypothetical protein